MENNVVKAPFVVRKYNELGEGYIKSGTNSQKYELIDDNKYCADDFSVKLSRKQYGPVTQQYVTVKNTSDCKLKLKQVSSAYIPGIGADGILLWSDPRRFKVEINKSAVEIYPKFLKLL